METFTSTQWVQLRRLLRGRAKLLTPTIFASLLLALLFTYAGCSTPASPTRSVESGSSRAHSQSSSGGFNAVSSEFASIVLAHLLSPNLEKEEITVKTRIPFSCFVVYITDGDTLRCIPVMYDSDVYMYVSPNHQTTIPSLSSVLSIDTENYVNMTEPPDVQIPAGLHHCGPLKDCVINVRLYGIDAPEVDHGKRSKLPAAAEAAAAAAAFYGSALLDTGGQPLGIAATAALSDFLLGRVALLHPLRRDRYGRMVARVLMPAVTNKRLDGTYLYEKYFETLFRHIANVAKSTPPWGAPTSSGPSEESQQKAELLLEALKNYQLQGSSLSAFSLARDTLRTLLGPLRDLDTNSEEEKGFSEGSDVEGASTSRRRKVTSPRNSLGRSQSFLMRVIESAKPPLLYDASVFLLQRGLSTLYTSKGAAYAGRETLLKSSEQRARLQQKGIWGLPETLQQSPLEYKKDTKGKSSKTSQTSRS